MDKKKLAERLKEEALRKQRALMKTAGIKRKFVVLSGKGGVGKSIVTANLALAAASLGLKSKVGILDTDVHGPSIPRYLGIDYMELEVIDGKVYPVEGPMGIKVVSASFMLPQKETPIIWRGPLKIKFIRDMITEIEWGDIEVLFIDTPPGTGDELQGIVHYVSKITGGIVVTIPSDVSLHVVKRSVTFLEKMRIPALGVIENMSYIRCPDGSVHNVFGEGGEKTAAKLGLQLLARIPMSNILSDPIDPENNPYELSPDEEPMSVFREVMKKLLS